MHIYGTREKEREREREIIAKEQKHLQYKGHTFCVQLTHLWILQVVGVVILFGMWNHYISFERSPLGRVQGSIQSKRGTLTPLEEAIKASNFSVKAFCSNSSYRYRMWSNSGRRELSFQTVTSATPSGFCVVQHGLLPAFISFRSGDITRGCELIKQLYHFPDSNPLQNGQLEQRVPRHHMWQTKISVDSFR